MISNYPRHESRSVFHDRSSTSRRSITMPDLTNESFSFDSTDSKRSDSIPIARNKLQRTPSEIQLDAEEAMADHRDYAMFQLIIDGIEKTQRKTRDCRWRHANNISLRGVYQARLEKSHEIPRQKLPAQLQLFDQAAFAARSISHGASDDDEVMPFALEM